jgi:hypothetical protein
MCLVTNATSDAVGSRAYRPAGGACTAGPRVGMAAAFLSCGERGRSRGRERGGVLEGAAVELGHKNLQ